MPSALNHRRAAQRKPAKEQAAHHDQHGKRHKRRHKRHKPADRRPVVQLHGTLGMALPRPPASPPAPSSAPVAAVGSPPLTLAQAQRLLWRAGFGPTPGQAEALVGQPLEQVVFSLTRPSGAATLTGPEPVERRRQAAAADERLGR